MDMSKFLLTVSLLSLLSYASYSDTSRDDEDFFKTCPSHRCSKHGPEIRFPFRLPTHDPLCGAPGMQLSCSGHDTILDHPVLGSCKVTAVYYRHRVIIIIPLVASSSHCPLQKLISRNQSTDVYKLQYVPGLPGSVLVGCSRDTIATDQYVVGPKSCLSLSNSASQFWYLVHPETDMSTILSGCVVIAKDIPIPYSYDNFGPLYDVYGKPSFKENAIRAINFGETTFDWYFNNITSACQQCEQQGQHCGFSSNTG